MSIMSDHDVYHDALGVGPVLNCWECECEVEDARVEAEEEAAEAVYESCAAVAEYLRLLATAFAFLNQRLLTLAQGLYQDFTQSQRVLANSLLFVTGAQVWVDRD